MSENGKWSTSPVPLPSCGMQTKLKLIKILKEEHVRKWAGESVVVLTRTPCGPITYLWESCLAWTCATFPCRRSTKTFQSELEVSLVGAEIHHCRAPGRLRPCYTCVSWYRVSSILLTSLSRCYRRPCVQCCQFLRIIISHRTKIL